MNIYLSTAIKAAIDGGKAIMDVYATDFDVVVKDDQSPLTIADQKANAIINTYLENTPFPIISEENKQLDYQQRKKWDTCWIVDPLDGTKEFVKRNGEFTVNIALVKNGTPVLGVIYVPVSKELYVADVNENVSRKYIVKGEWQQEDFDKYAEVLTPRNASKNVEVVGSRSHMNDDTLAYVNGIKSNGKEVAIVSKGSSLKFCLVAEGNADVYPRFAPTMEWDTAAGHAICKAVGIPVIAQDTMQEMKYNKENLLNPYFTVNHQ